MHAEERTDAMKELTSDAIQQAKRLLAAEIDLAKEDLREATSAAARSAIAFGVAGFSALVGAEALVVSIAVSGRRRGSARSAAVGIGLLAVAAAAAFIGRASLPQSPARAAARIASDVEDVARRVAA